MLVFHGVLASDGRHNTLDGDQTIAAPSGWTDEYQDLTGPAKRD
jgi:hypothetical protein